MSRCPVCSILWALVKEILIASHPGFPATEPRLSRTCDPVNQRETQTHELHVHCGQTSLRPPCPPDKVR